MRFIRQHCKNTPSVRKRTVGSQLKRTVSKSLCPKSVVLSNSVPLHVTDIQVNKTTLGVKTINGAYQARKVIFLDATICPTILLLCFSLVFLHGLTPFAGRTSRYLLNQQPSANGEPWSSIIQSTGVTSSGLWLPTIGGYAFELSTVPTLGPDVIRLKSLSYVHCWAGLPSDRRSHDAPGWYFCKYNG